MLTSFSLIGKSAYMIRTITKLGLEMHYMQDFASANEVLETDEVLTLPQCIHL